ncbi:hypothetical protein LCGC14_1576450 [marine sediment metagenome]|uniref:Uncharacterized protein n=1 Tax=marine sediment metagenome TaxID=412755 RepID=A0A0F9II98_9ZZZZ
MACYLLKEHEKNILFRIPFTVYFVWCDPEYKKFRLVVKELREVFTTDEFFPEDIYSYLII